MEGNANPFPFANDGSFLERFKQLQEQASKTETSSATTTTTTTPAADPSLRSTAAPPVIKKANSSFVTTSGSKPASSQKTTGAPSSTSGSKIGFSLKQKSKLPVNPLKLGEDEDEDDGQDTVSDSDPALKSKRYGSSPPGQLPMLSTDTTPPPPKDPEVKKVADKLAHFVAKNGRQFEDLTRQKNPGDTPFRFLFDVNCSDYKYYTYRLAEESKALAAEPSTHTSGSNSTAVSRSGSHQSRTGLQNSNYQTPASALYANDDRYSSRQPRDVAYAESPSNVDSLAMMEFYMQKAAQEDLRKPLKRSRDEMPPPASLQAPSPPAKKGHHMGDYIPPEELERFLAKCNDAMTNKLNKETAERVKIQPDNVGHRLLSKMGWKEGEGLGSGKDGRAVPVEAGAVKLNNLGVGAEQPGEVTPDDDIYEQYKKRMMLGYRFRPNPLNNPRKAYY